jgi:polysaccharide chain length determinant protein (PEP-CTERM system associated)
MLGHRSLNIEDYLTILKRRWWIIAVPAVILPIVAVAVSFFVTPQYTSQTLVLINQQKVPENIVKPVVTEDLTSRLASMREQIMSRASLEPIIKKYNLYDSLHSDMDARIAQARNNIGIDPIQSEIRSNGLPGFKIFFTAGDPQTAQQVCAEITSLFTSANVKNRADTARGTTSFLQEQVDQEKAKLDEMEQKLASFKRQFAGMLPEDIQGSTSILTTLNSRLDATTQQSANLQQNKTMAESMLSQQLQALAATPAGSTVRGPGVEEKELENLEAQETDLSAHYTDEYPALKRVRGRIADLQKQMAKEAAAPAPVVPTNTPPRVEPASIQQLRTQIRLMDGAIAAKHKEQELIQAQIGVYQGRIQSSPQVEEQEKELTRDYQTTLEAYNSLKASLDQSRMATDLELRQQGETFDLLDAANLPESPTFPNRTVFGVGGFVGGLALGLAIVALLEYKDTALRSERDIWAFTQLPTLAVIAWANETGTVARTGRSFFGRLFRRKSTKNQLADAPG